MGIIIRAKGDGKNPSTEWASAMPSSVPEKAAVNKGRMPSNGQVSKVCAKDDVHKRARQLDRKLAARSRKRHPSLQQPAMADLSGSGIFGNFVAPVAVAPKECCKPEYDNHGRLRAHMLSAKAEPDSSSNEFTQTIKRHVQAPTASAIRKAPLHVVPVAVLTAPTLVKMMKDHAACVILMHTTGCPLANEFAPTFQQLAELLPGLACGRIDVTAERWRWPTVAAVSSASRGVATLSPSLVAIVQRGKDATQSRDSMTRPGREHFVLEYSGDPTLEAVHTWANTISHDNDGSLVNTTSGRIAGEAHEVRGSCVSSHAAYSATPSKLCREAVPVPMHRKAPGRERSQQDMGRRSCIQPTRLTARPQLLRPSSAAQWQPPTQPGSASPRAALLNRAASFLTGKEDEMACHLAMQTQPEGVSHCSSHPPRIVIMGTDLRLADESSQHAANTGQIDHVGKCAPSLPPPNVKAQPHKQRKATSSPPYRSPANSIDDSICADRGSVMPTSGCTSCIVRPPSGPPAYIAGEETTGMRSAEDLFSPAKFDARATVDSPALGGAPTTPTPRRPLEATSSCEPQSSHAPGTREQVAWRPPPQPPAHRASTDGTPRLVWGAPAWWTAPDRVVAASDKFVRVHDERVARANRLWQRADNGAGDAHFGAACRKQISRVSKSRYIEPESHLGLVRLTEAMSRDEARKATAKVAKRAAQPGWIWAPRERASDAHDFFDNEWVRLQRFELDWSRAVEEVDVAKAIAHASNGEEGNEMEALAAVLWNSAEWLYPLFRAYASIHGGNGSGMDFAAWSQCSDQLRLHSDHLKGAKRDDINALMVNVASAASRLRMRAERLAQQLTAEREEAQETAAGSGAEDNMDDDEWIMALRAAEMDITHNTKRETELSRSDWLGLLVHVSVLRFVRSGEEPTASRALSRLLKQMQRLSPPGMCVDADAFRAAHCYTEEANSELILYEERLRHIYAAISGSVNVGASAHQQLALRQWETFLHALGFIGVDLSERDATFAFTWSTMAVVDGRSPPGREREVRLTFEVCELQYPQALRFAF